VIDRFYGAHSIICKAIWLSISACGLIAQELETDRRVGIRADHAAVRR
jgi:hypothetical protein